VRSSSSASKRSDQELDEELRDHLDRKTEEYVAQAMTREEAHRRARIDLDGIEQTNQTIIASELTCFPTCNHSR